MKRLKPLAQQSIVVTGATSGNGLAITRMAVKAGARVMAVARNRDALEALQQQFGFGQLAICVADVADPAAVERIADAAQAAFGGFDAWINNAGTGAYGSLEQIPLEDHRRIFDVNYFGTLYGSLTAARHLRRRGGGAIVNIGSILGDRAIVEQGPYSATKHAVQALTDTLRMELEREDAHISVTLIKPSAIDTPFPEHARNFMAKPPRLPQPLYAPDVVADAALFACANPRRVIYAGGGGAALSALARVAPRLTDGIMEVAGRLAQQSRQDGEPGRRDNLYAPRADALRGSQSVAARETSLAVQVQKLSPRAVQFGGLGLGAALVVAAMIARRGAGHSDGPPSTGR